MAISPTLFQDAPLAVIDSCALKHLFTPVRPALLADGNTKKLYIDPIVDAARQGFLQIGLPASVIYETSGHNPLTGNVVDRMFLDEKRSVIYHQGQIARNLGAIALAGGLPNVRVMQSEEGVALLSKLEELSDRGHRTRSFVEFDALRKSKDVDGLTRKAAQQNAGQGGSVLITEDRDSREAMFGFDASGAKLAAGNLMCLFQALHRNDVLPHIGFKETTTPGAVLENFRDYTSQLNDQIDRVKMRRERAVMTAYTRPVENSGIESLDAMIAEWLPKREVFVTPEVAKELSTQPPWHHKGSPPLALAKEEKPAREPKKHTPRTDLRGGLGSGAEDIWKR